MATLSQPKHLRKQTQNHSQFSHRITQGNQRGGVANRERGGGQKPDKSHIQCYNCQKYGHYSSDCPEKRKNQESDAKFTKHEEEEMMLMVTTRDGDRFKDQWYLDSGCSSHMSRRKDWFININP